MKKWYSSWGFVVSGVYVLLSLGTLIFAYNCTSFGCGGVTLLTMLPWILFLDEAGVSIELFGVNLRTEGDVWFLLIVILNTVLLYFIWALIQKWSESRN